VNQTEGLPYPEQREAAVRELIAQAGRLTSRRVQAIMRRHARPDGGLFTRDEILRTYRAMCRAAGNPLDPRVVRHLRRKPTRTISGVAPVTVLTRPQPCRGDCIYCPSLVDVPKSYLPKEPGVQRALRFEFDPYAQTAGRIQALRNIGHRTDKVELLVLGGTWSDYPPEYQTWFIRRCFDAMNEREAETIEAVHRLNEAAPNRNVGLVLETRPDCVTPDEVRRMRWLGATKVQLGAQSLDDRILALNRRGHTVETTRAAVRRLRLAGFKIVLHWMPNLLGATPESDLADFRRLWDDPAIRPDELKIYPCLLLEDTALHDRWQAGEYQPYDQETMVELLAECKTTIPAYCRVNRVMRDIPAPYIVSGVDKSNLRQIVQQRMEREGQECRCIRCREVRGRPIDPDALRFQVTSYDTDATQERFLSYETPEGWLVGFLRLSLPHATPEMAELEGCAVVREVHVYGPALALGAQRDARPQHSGLGTDLLERADEMAQSAGYPRLAVIAAVGTRPYYRERGFELEGLYMRKDLRGLTISRRRSALQP
jgi:elongator complex protein 3